MFRNLPPFFVVTGLDGSGKTTTLARAATISPLIKPVSWTQFGSILTSLPHLTAGQSEAPALAIDSLQPFARTAAIQYLVSLELDQVYRNTSDQALVSVIDSYWYRFAAKNMIMNFADGDLKEIFIGFPEPEMVFLIDTPVRACLMRKAPAHRYETGEGNAELFQATVRDNLLRIIPENKLVILDGESSPEAVAADLFLRIKDIIQR